MTTGDMGMYWTDERWRQWAGYADEVKVQVKFVRDLTQDDPDEVWSFDFGPEFDWDREWLERHLAELATADEASCCGHGNYTLDSSARRTEWGATGAVQDFVLVVSTGILSSALWHGFLTIANKMSERSLTGTVATAEQAMELSKSRVLLHVGNASHHDLEAVSAVEEKGVWTVEVRVRRTGDKFTVETFNLIVRLPGLAPNEKGTRFARSQRAPARLRPGVGHATELPRPSAPRLSVWLPTTRTLTIRSTTLPSSCDRSTARNRSRPSCADMPRTLTTLYRPSVVATVASGWVADVGEVEQGARNPNAQPHIPDYGHPRGDSDWMKDAACVGPSAALFFSRAQTDRDEAKRICMRCPVLLDCADYSARVGPSFAVWAGGNEARLYVASRRARADADRQQAAKAEPAPTSAQIGA